MQIYACFIRSESMMITQAFSPQLMFLSTFLKNGKIFPSHGYTGTGLRI